MLPRLLLLILASLAPFLTTTSAHAQDDKWSFIVTPQVWVSHIAKNGLVPPGTLAGQEPISAGPDILRNPFAARDSSPVDGVNPQWGFQVAAQRGRWTLAGAFQYVTFETRSDLVYTPSNGQPLGSICLSPCPLNPGERAAQEFVSTTRMDMDFAAIYSFPDVVPNLIDFSVGGGVKAIYASASRQYGNLSPFAAAFAGLPPPGLYRVCGRDDCSDSGFRDRVKTFSWLYGATMPTSTVFHLTSDARWLMPLSITPFLGAETRDDRDVVYSYNYDVPSKGQVRVNRLDGTKLAYGVTADATLRWILSDTLSVYGGMRVQYIKGHEQFLAYGPLIGMSVRFGGR